MLTYTRYVFRKLNTHFCSVFCTIWKTNGSKVLFLLQLITVFFSHTDSNKNISRPWASLTVKNKILLVSVVVFYTVIL